MMLTSLDEGAITGSCIKSWTRTFSQNTEDLWWMHQHDKDQDTKEELNKKYAKIVEPPGQPTDYRDFRS